MLVAAASSLPGPAEADAVPLRIAVAPVSGPKRASPKRFQRGLVKGLTAAGMKVIRPKKVARAARKAGGSVDDVPVAASLNADFLLVVELARVRRAYGASALLIDVRADEPRHEFTASYRKRKKALVAAKRFGRKIAGWIADSMNGEVAADDKSADDEPTLDDLFTDGMAQDDESKGALSQASGRDQLDEPGPDESVNASVGRSPVIAPTAAEPSTSQSSTSQSDRQPVSSVDEVVESDVGIQGSRPAAGGSRRVREDAIFRVGAFAGTQVATNYTVDVDGEGTGLGYDLGLLFLAGADLSLRLPGLGLGFEGVFSYTPVSYELNVMPELPVQNPSGSFISAGGGAYWAFELLAFGDGGGLWLAPLVGANYAAMSAESQGPDSVVVSWSAFDVHGGARFTVRATQNLAFDVDGRAGFVLAFSEDPTETGQDGGGLSIRVGGQARYWLLDGLAVSVRVGYHRQSIALSGTGTRAGFVGDPDLVDARVAFSDIKMGAGAQVAF